MRLITLSLRRTPGTHLPGFVGAVTGALLASALFTAVAGLLLGLPSMSQLVLIFGINAIMVVGYQTFAGNTGIVSFGHVAFMALGAYAGGIAAIPASQKKLLFPDMPALLSSWSAGGALPLLIGGAVAGAAALITGPALMRLSGAAASIATLGLLIIVNNLIAQATPITRGPQSFFGVPANTTFTWVFVCLALAVLLSSAFKWSRWGRNARAVRDNPAAAAAAGVSIVGARTMSFIVSAFITGVAGALYAQLLTAFSPESFYVQQVVLIVAMAIFGGINSVTGALAGAAVVSALNEVMRHLETGVNVAGLTLQLPSGVDVAVLGIVLVVSLLLRPDGLIGPNELIISRRRGRIRDKDADREGGQKGPEEEQEPGPPHAPRTPPLTATAPTHHLNAVPGSHSTMS